MTDEDDPIAYFLEDLEGHGRNPRTIEAYRRVLRRFEQFVCDHQDRSCPTDASYRDCMAWVHRLRATHADSTIASYTSYLNRFYSYLVRVGRTGDNPMGLVMEELTERIETNPSRRDISLAEMQDFVASITHPLHCAIVVTLLKTGMRSGELCNLDLRDLHLGADHWWTPRAQIAGRNAIYVDTTHTVGRESSGEIRSASNKRKRETIVPIDGELACELWRWLAIRPDTRSEADPLFVGTSDRWGERLTPDIVHHIVTAYARDMGWYRDGAGSAENVTPHYFRHFFTTHMRDRIGDRGIVKYLRGDVADDVIDTYTHNWGDRVRTTYLEHVYRVGAGTDR